MSNYDEFEREMQEAGWSLEDIEAMYQAHLFDLEIEAAEVARDMESEDFIE